LAVDGGGGARTPMVDGVRVHAGRASSRGGALSSGSRTVAPWRIRRGVRCNNPRLRSPARRCRGLRAAAAQTRSGPEGRGRCARRPEGLMKRLFTRLDSECSSANSRAFHATVPQTGSRADAGATSGREPAPWMDVHVRSGPYRAHATRELVEQYVSASELITVRRWTARPAA
jgi:hypothetical protein